MLGTFPKSHTVRNILDMLKKGEWSVHMEQERTTSTPQVGTACLSNPVKIKAVCFASQVQLRETFSLTRDTDWRLRYNTYLILS